MSTIHNIIGTISTVNLIIGIAVGVVLAALLVGFRRRYRDLFGVLLVVGIAGLALAVTIYRVDQYRSDRAAATASDEAKAPAYGSEPPASPPRPPVGFPSFGPMVHPPTGGAAPPAAQNPYAGGG